MQNFKKTSGFLLLLTTLACTTYLLGSPRALAVPEVGYAAAMSGQVLPFMEANGRRESFAGVGGLRIQTLTVEGSGPKGDVVLVSGQGEFIGKYLEVAYDLLQRGYSAVHIIDHRGQGESARVLPNEPKKGSVENFDFYVRDLDTFVTRLHDAHPSRKLFLLSHSMGGAVSALYLENLRSTGRTGMFDAVALVAPMFEIKAPVVNEGHRLLDLVTVLCNIGLGNEFAFGKSHFNEYVSFDGSGSELRWDFTKSYVDSHTTTTISGPTNRWLKEAIVATNRTAKLSPPKDLPILLLQAGKDSVVINPPQNAYCAKSPSCSLTRYETAVHEILMETDAIRTPALDRIDGFFSNH